MLQNFVNLCNQQPPEGIRMHQICFVPSISRHSPRPPSRTVRGYPSPSTPSASRSRRLSVCPPIYFLFPFASLCPSTPQFWGPPYISAYTLWRKTTIFDVVKHIARRFLCDKHDPTPAGPALPNLVAYTLCHRTTKFDVVRCMRRQHVIRGSATAPSQRGGAQALPVLGVSSVYYYTLWRTTKLGVVTHMGNGLVFRQSATPCIPRQHGPSRPQFCVFSASYAYTDL